MEQYLNQLLEDLKNAQKNLPTKVDYTLLYPDHPANNQSYNGVMDYMIEWENAPEWKMDDLFEVKGAAFPPVEQLSEVQAKKLINGILELWGCFNICADILNEDIPVQIIYKVLVNYWKTETVQYMSEGTLHLEFCDYDENNCPWGYEYCTCKNIEVEDFENINSENESLKNIDLNEDDLPF